MKKELTYNNVDAGMIPEMATKENRCELCKFYIPIDSTTGYCKRYPPQTVMLEKKGFWSRFSNKFTVKYQDTFWCMRACGEYSRKSKI